MGNTTCERKQGTSRFINVPFGHILANKKTYKYLVFKFWNLIDSCIGFTEGKPKIHTTFKKAKSCPKNCWVLFSYLWPMRNSQQPDKCG